MLEHIPELAGKDIIVLDFETYYDAQFSLSKMQMVEYINDPRFKVHMVGLRSGDVSTCVETNAVDALFNQLNWDNTIVIGHHMQFDSYILEHYYGYHPFLRIDTAALSRYLNGKRVGRSHSLQMVSRYLGVGEKGKELALSKGVKDLQLAGVYDDIAGYCVYNEDSDVNLTYRCAEKMLPHVGLDILKLQDWSVQLYTKPTLRLNRSILEEAREEENTRMNNDLRMAISAVSGAVRDLPIIGEIRKTLDSPGKRALSKVADMRLYDADSVEELIQGVVATARSSNPPLSDDHVRQIATDAFNAYNTFWASEGDELLEQARKTFNSAPKMKNYLEQLGVEVPMKTSKTTGKQIPALSKTDEGMVDLLEHEDTRVAAAARARLSIRNANVWNRSLRLIQHYDATGGEFSVPLYASGAVQTNRYAGGDKLNVQNLSRGSKLRQAIEALRDDHCVLAADYSNVEARVTDAMAGVDWAVEGYRKGDDPYIPLAAEIYGIAEDMVEGPQRQSGKVTKLSCQYGVGAKTLRKTARFQWGVDMTEEAAQQSVAAYRTKYHQVPALWRLMDDVLVHMQNPECNYTLPLGTGLSIQVMFEKLVMPTGFEIKYPNLRTETYKDKETGEIKIGLVYGVGSDLNFIWGGTVVENMSQHLAGEIANHHLLAFIDHGLPPALMVHDEFVWTAPRDRAEAYRAAFESAMGTQIPWWPAFPVAAEAKFGDNYLECK